MLAKVPDHFLAAGGPNDLWTLLKPGSVPLATLGSDIVRKLDAEGWHLSSAPPPNPESPAAATYAGPRNGLDMQLLEINNPASPGLREEVSIDVSASCFNAGSSASSASFLDGYDRDINEPRPSSAP